MRATLLLAPLILSMATSGEAAEASRWSLRVGGLAAAPTSPAAFRDGWGWGWGLEGGVARGFGTRLELGLDGRYQQFQFDGETPPGAEVLGGARRFGLVSLRIAAELYRSPRGGRDAVTAELGSGYVHQSIEPISGMAPLASGPADGFDGSVGLVYSRTLYAATRIELGLRHTWLVLPEETLGSFEVRLGAAVPLSAE